MVSVSYVIDGTEQVEEVNTPWQLEVEVDGGFSIEVVVENPGETGDVVCGISGLTPVPARAVGEATATCRASGTASSGNVSVEFDSSSEDRPVPAPTATPVLVPTPEQFAAAGLEPVDRLIAGLPPEEDFEEEIQKSLKEYVEQVGEEMANENPFWVEALNDVLAKGQQIF